MESWRAVVGYEGEYLVSDMGRVMTVTGRIIGTYVNKDGYHQVSLGTAVKLVHRLVAFAFLPYDAYRQQVNHKDFNKLNNAVSNLEWVSPMENTIHAARGRRLGKLTEEEVLFIRAWHRSRFTYAEIGEVFGMSRDGIRQVAQRKTYAWVGSLP